jgi:hypothetical protein
MGRGESSIVGVFPAVGRQPIAQGRFPMRLLEERMKRIPVRLTFVFIVALTLAMLPTNGALAAPGNDDITNATVIPSLPFDDTLDSSTATTAPDDPSCGDAASVWYSFTADADVHMAVRASSDHFGFPFLSVYTGSPGSLTQLGCNSANEIAGQLVPAQIVLDATAGTTFYIMVAAGDPGGGFSPPGTFHLTVFGPPANDDITNSTVIPSLPFTDAVDMTTATTASDDPDCGAPTLWYSFTAPSDMGVGVNLQLDTLRELPHASVYSGTPGNLSQITCYSWSDVEDMNFAAAAGTTYYIMVAGPVFRFDPFIDLTFYETTLPPHVGIAVDDTSTVNPKTGVANVSGTIACSPVNKEGLVTSLTVEGVLSQKVGRQTFQASFALTGTCSAPLIPWTATATSSQGLFVGGKATVSVSVSATNPVGSDFASVGPMTIKLKGGG